MSIVGIIYRTRMHHRVRRHASARLPPSPRRYPQLFLALLSLIYVLFALIYVLFSCGRQMTRRSPRNLPLPPTRRFVFSRVLCHMSYAHYFLFPTMVGKSAFFRAKTPFSAYFSAICAICARNAQSPPTQRTEQTENFLFPRFLPNGIKMKNVCT